MIFHGLPEELRVRAAYNSLDVLGFPLHPPGRSTRDNRLRLKRGIRLADCEFSIRFAESHSVQPTPLRLSWSQRAEALSYVRRDRLFPSTRSLPDRRAVHLGLFHA